MCFLKHSKSAAYIAFLTLPLPPPPPPFLQVCEERLQFSLSENVKTNVLWGSTMKDTVILRPWGEQIKEDGTEVVTVEEQKEDERYEKAD